MSLKFTRRETKRKMAFKGISAAAVVTAMTAVVPSSTFAQQATAAVPNGPAWEIARSKDAMTDEETVLARLTGAQGADNTRLLVRCEAGVMLDVGTTFHADLGKGRRPVRYRIDQNPPRDETWPVSDKGLMVFAPYEGDFTRQLIGAKKVLIEVTDARGVAHRAAYEWSSGSEHISEVLQACKRAPQGLEVTVPGVSKPVATQLERMGPRSIALKKQALASMAGFKGKIDSQMTPEFALAVQAYQDSYLQRCDAGKLRGQHCTIKKGREKLKLPSSEPDAGLLIYEQAPKALQKKMADLRDFD